MLRSLVGSEMCIRDRQSRMLCALILDWRGNVRDAASTSATAAAGILSHVARQMRAARTLVSALHRFKHRVVCGMILAWRIGTRDGCVANASAAMALLAQVGKQVRAGKLIFSALQKWRSQMSACAVTSWRLSALAARSEAATKLELKLSDHARGCRAMAFAMAGLLKKRLGECVLAWRMGTRDTISEAAACTAARLAKQARGLREIAFVLMRAVKKLIGVCTLSWRINARAAGAARQERISQLSQQVRAAKRIAQAFNLRVATLLTSLVLGWRINTRDASAVSMENATRVGRREQGVGGVRWAVRRMTLDALKVAAVSWRFNAYDAKRCHSVAETTRRSRQQRGARGLALTLGRLSKGRVFGHVALWKGKCIHQTGRFASGVSKMRAVLARGQRVGSARAISIWHSNLATAALQVTLRAEIQARALHMQSQGLVLWFLGSRLLDFKLRRWVHLVAELAATSARSHVLAENESDAQQRAELEMGLVAEQMELISQLEEVRHVLPLMAAVEKLDMFLRAGLSTRAHAWITEVRMRLGRSGHEALVAKWRRYGGCAVLLCWGVEAKTTSLRKAAWQWRLNCAAEALSTERFWQTVRSALGRSVLQQAHAAVLKWHGNVVAGVYGGVVYDEMIQVQAELIQKHHRCLFATVLRCRAVFQLQPRRIELAVRIWRHGTLAHKTVFALAVQRRAREMATEAARRTSGRQLLVSIFRTIRTGESLLAAANALLGWKLSLSKARLGIRGLAESQFDAMRGRTRAVGIKASFQLSVLATLRLQSLLLRWKMQLQRFQVQFATNQLLSTHTLQLGHTLPLLLMVRVEHQMLKALRNFEANSRRARSDRLGTQAMLAWSQESALARLPASLLPAPTAELCVLRWLSSCKLACNAKRASEVQRILQEQVLAARAAAEKAILERDNMIRWQNQVHSCAAQARHALERSRSPWNRNSHGRSASSSRSRPASANPSPVRSTRERAS
eukprot:TRINITY_DN8014_c0_g1_i1.p1 TRINITY_DN8014_c0_g1~~TRINITY_DN8014_c0_g1_i1.p1  ORF type:complete len:979 (+),score=202.92 TRINITY_DN8014_c0_g1_i1:25-2937(+)